VAAVAFYIRSGRPPTRRTEEKLLRAQDSCMSSGEFEPDLASSGDNICVNLAAQFRSLWSMIRYKRVQNTLATSRVTNCSGVS